MIKDIEYPEVKDIAIAIVREEAENGDQGWNVYLLNLRNELIDGVLVSSKGYGMVNGEDVKTSTLRHFLDELKPNTATRIEPIMEDVFRLSNEYWVSFYINKIIYDKKFIFLPETIKDEYFTLIPLLNKRGVMIK